MENAVATRDFGLRASIYTLQKNIVPRSPTILHRQTTKQQQLKPETWDASMNPSNLVSLQATTLTPSVVKRQVTQKDAAGVVKLDSPECDCMSCLSDEICESCAEGSLQGVRLAQVFALHATAQSKSFII